MARTYQERNYEPNQHEAIEIMLSMKGRGALFVGDYMGEYKEDEIYSWGTTTLV